jgi:uncharacterized membrane protein HdeD (DUF308 family)
MQVHISSGDVRGTAYTIREVHEAGRDLGRYWWVWLVTGIAWVIASLVVLQFDAASITTVGVIVGVMFAVAAAQQLVLAAFADSLRWLWALFGALFAAAAVICFVSPENTFVAMADILGFLFLSVGVWWTIRAFMLKAVESTWWMELVAGVLMLVMAFWASGQFFVEKAYTLLVFAGIWALLHGITDIVGAFRLRSLRNLG